MVALKQLIQRACTSRPSFIMFIIMLLSVDAGALVLKDLHLTRTNDITVYYEESLENAAKEVISIYPRVISEIQGMFMYNVELHPEVVLIKKHDSFIGITKNDYIVAFAQPERGLIVIDYSKMKSFYMLVDTLKHELSHLFLFKITGRKLPRWFDEGLSQWVTGGVSEIIEGKNSGRLKRAVLTGRLLPIKSLETFPSEREALLLAYEQSKSFVEYMVERFGRENIAMILERVGSGDELDDAIARVLSLSIYEIENDWVSQIKKKTTYITYLSDHIYEIIFFLAALLTVYGFVRLYIKKVRYRDEDEDDGHISQYPPYD